MPVVQGVEASRAVVEMKLQAANFEPAKLFAALGEEKVCVVSVSISDQVARHELGSSDADDQAVPSKVVALSAKQLKEQLVLRGVKFADCREKWELVDRLKQALLDDEMEGVGPSQYASPQTTPVVSPATAPPAASPPPV